MNIRILSVRNGNVICIPAVTIGKFGDVFKITFALTERGRVSKLAYRNVVEYEEQYLEEAL